MIEVKISDGMGSGRLVGINKHHSLCVAPTDPEIPAVGTFSRLRFLSGLAGATDIDSGSTAMNVDGSSTPQEFFVKSNTDYDIRIMKLMIYIQDSAVTHAGFGNLAALTNGIDIFITEAGAQTFLVKSAKTFAHLIEQTLAAAPFGDDASSFELTNVSGTSDANILPFDLGVLVPGGVRIGRATQDGLTVRINDNLTGLESFTVRIVGYRHYP